MKTTVLNYRIIIEPERDASTGKIVYNAYAPKLGVADFGLTIEKAKEHIKEAIECHIESLLKHNDPVPEPDSSEYLISETEVTIPSNYPLTFT